MEIPIFSTRQNTWRCIVRGDALVGLVMALVLIAEAVILSLIIAAVAPLVGLCASSCFAEVIAFGGWSACWHR